MPQIMVTAVRGDGKAEGSVLMWERVNVDDFESDRFAALLVERLGWAVSDADAMEKDLSSSERG